MDRFNNFRNYLSNVNRSVLLAIGLVVVAGLLAATFIYGDADSSNDAADNDQTVASNETANNESEDELDVSGGEADENSEEGEEGVSLPSELADTGPATPVLALSMLAASSYLFKRSQKKLQDARLE